MALHEHAALGGLIAIAVHGITLLGDTLAATPARSASPSRSRWTTSPLFTGLGIVGGYLAAALGLSFYARRRIGAKLWRKLHRATILVYVLAVVHTLGAGTRRAEPWLRTAMAITGAPILYLLVVRMLPAPQRRRGRRTADRHERHPRRLVAHELGAEGAADLLELRLHLRAQRLGALLERAQALAHALDLVLELEHPLDARPGSCPARRSAPGSGAGGRRPPGSTGACPSASAAA